MSWQTDVSVWVDKPETIQVFSDDGREQDYVPERTCNLSKVTSWDDDGHNTWGVICSSCDAHIEHDTGYGIRYCPSCGARVVK